MVDTKRLLDSSTPAKAMIVCEIFVHMANFINIT